MRDAPLAPLFGAVARATLGDLPPAVVAELFAAARWQAFDRDAVLVRRGDACAGLHLIVDGAAQITWGEHGPAATVSAPATLGALPLLTGEPHPASAVAIRSGLACLLPRAALDAALGDDPLRSTRLARTVAATVPGHGPPIGARPCLTVRAAHPGAPVDDVARGLADCLAAGGPSRCVGLDTIAHALGVTATGLADPDGTAWRRVYAWWADVRAAAPAVVFVDGGECPAWSRFCHGRSDAVIAVARAGTDPGAARLSAPAGGPRWLLALVHPAATDLPRDAARWARAADDARLVHLRGLGRRELARLTRLATDRAVGVVLGGGNAHAMAHLGALLALDEAGVPVDLIGGTSFGAVVAGVWAMRLTMGRIRALGRDLVDLRPFRAITLPRRGLLKGAPFDWIAHHTFGESHFEDLWLGMYCVSVDLTARREVVHDRGLVWRAVRASGSLPAIIEPHVEGDAVFVDGGVLNNLPVDVMRRRTQGPVIAVDVSADASTPTSLGIFDVLTRSMTTASAVRTADARGAVDLYVRPDVGRLGGTRFDALDRFIRAGRRAAAPGARALRHRLESRRFVL